MWLQIQWITKKKCIWSRNERLYQINLLLLLLLLEIKTFFFYYSKWLPDALTSIRHFDDHFDGNNERNNYQIGRKNTNLNKLTKRTELQTVKRQSQYVTLKVKSATKPLLSKMPLLWNCSVCRQLLNVRPILCPVCNCWVHMYCVREEEFWNSPTRTICRKCFVESQRTQEVLQNQQAVIRREAAALISQIQTLAHSLGNTLIEDATDIIALDYFIELLEEMRQTLSSLQPR